MGTHEQIGSGAALEVTIHGALDGSGPVVCAAHPAEAFGQATAALLAEVSGAGAVVCVNPRGLGASPAAPASGYSVEQMADDVEAVRLRLGLRPWVFWGMSGGGWIGELYAHRHPDALAGLIVESACACFRARLADPACILSPLNPMWRPTLEGRGLIAADSHAATGDGRETEWTEVAGVGSVWRRRGGPALLVSPMPVAPEMARAMPALWAVDARPLLGGLRLPTLVVAGEADPVVPIAHARAVHEAIPGSRFVAVAGAGHVPTAARASEAAEAVGELLRGLGRK